jgi:hypothetical protein
MSQGGLDPMTDKLGLVGKSGLLDPDNLDSLVFFVSDPLTTKRIGFVLYDEYVTKIDEHEWRTGFKVLPDWLFLNLPDEVVWIVLYHDDGRIETERGDWWKDYLGWAYTLPMARVH